ncbi:flagellar biosynthesis, cell-distal portion of basal-body rod [Klebsiella pneumoniae]|nr:flagellar biosynthesis, cell-distal portion of basal-body rod [Klebsiella pneumoniae]
MAEFIPPLGTADPQIFMDNVRRLDQLMQSSELTFPDRAGELLYTWYGNNGGFPDKTTTSPARGTIGPVVGNLRYLDRSTVTPG